MNRPGKEFIISEELYDLAKFKFQRDQPFTFTFAINH